MTGTCCVLHDLCVAAGWRFASGLEERIMTSLDDTVGFVGLCVAGTLVFVFVILKHLLSY